MNSSEKVAMDSGKGVGSFTTAERNRPVRSSPGNFREDRLNCQPPLPQSCPRCNSGDTKFCYYNNYSLAQPRYYCKACRRYWTHGGSLRNVPIGGGSRKNKRGKPTAECEVPPTSSQSLMGLLPGVPSIRRLPAAVPPVGNSFFAGGTHMSFPAVPSLMNQSVKLLYGQNMGFLQSTNLCFRNTPATQFQTPAPDQYTPWAHEGYMASAGAAASAGCNSDAGGNHASSSFIANQWPDCDHGFNP